MLRAHSMIYWDSFSKHKHTHLAFTHKHIHTDVHSDTHGEALNLYLWFNTPETFPEESLEDVEYKALQKILSHQDVTLI